MKFKQITVIVATAMALGAFGTAAHAQVPDDASFSGMWKMDYIDTNKDGMMSKAEFLATMGKVWDKKAKEMKLKDDKMTADEMKALERWLSRASKN